MTHGVRLRSLGFIPVPHQQVELYRREKREREEEREAIDPEG